jgi:hypothetical protein
MNFGIYNNELQMYGARVRTPGYHSKLTEKLLGHATLDNARYALFLLESRKPQNINRACDIIRRVISLQDQAPDSRTYGIWPWFYEEPLEKMNPPDWNWAEFIGAAWCHLLIEFQELLPADVAELAADSLGHAAWSIFRRNILPRYTNIAITGIAVCAAAGEILKEKRLVEYAKIRAKSFYGYTFDYNRNAFNEYNSPTYSFVALRSLEQMCYQVKDTIIKEYAEKLRNLAWSLLAEHYHVPTRQLCGPHSRAYANRLQPPEVEYLQWATSEQPDGLYRHKCFTKGLPCPSHLRSRFHQGSTTESEIKRNCIRMPAPIRSFTSTAWMNGKLCLGSICHETFWAQRRVMMGYWGSSSLRLRMLKDGRDFASGAVFNTQYHNRLLSGFGFWNNRGDFHFYFDQAADNTYRLEELCIRYELETLEGKATAEPVSENCFAMSTENRKVLVYTPESCSCNGQPITWSCGVSADNKLSYVQCLIAADCDFQINEKLNLLLASGMEIVDTDADVKPESINFSRKNNNVTVSWAELELEYPVVPEKYLDR